MALSGMTGFGRAESALGAWSWAVEARSVNGRNLDIRFRGPAGFDGLERATRERAQSRFQRGQLTVGLQARRSESTAPVTINIGQLERYLHAGAPYVASGQAAPARLDGLLALRGVIEAVEGDNDADAQAAIEAAMAASISEALDRLAAARFEEGTQLGAVLHGQLERIRALISSAEALASEQPKAIRDRFARRMAELAGDGAFEDRIVQEAAALAVKADVREELDRLTGHVTTARGLLTAGGPSGRRLDFLAQEFMREANTLCSKSALGALTAVGLDLKAAVEQFREQVQNVE